MPRPLLPIVLALAVVALAAAPAAAHAPAPVPTPAPVVVAAPDLVEAIGAAEPDAALPWFAIAGLLTLTLIAAWQPRRALAMGLVLIAGVLAFETGVHSTHHLGQSDEHCVVAGMAAQLSGDLVAAVDDAPPSAATTTVAALPATPVVTARSVAPDAGRAPPVLSV